MLRRPSYGDFTTPVALVIHARSSRRENARRADDTNAILEHGFDDLLSGLAGISEQLEYVMACLEEERLERLSQ